MFRVTQSPKFWSEIEFDVMTEEELKPRRVKFEQQFPRMSTNEIETFSQAMVKERLDDMPAARMLLLGTWKTVVYPPNGKVELTDEQKKIVPMQWRGVVDEEDQPLQLNAGNVDALLANYGVATAIIRKFFADIGKAAIKN